MGANQVIENQWGAEDTDRDDKIQVKTIKLHWLLAPTGALIVIVVYYITSAAQPLFEIFFLKWYNSSQLVVQYLGSIAMKMSDCQ